MDLKSKIYMYQARLHLAAFYLILELALSLLGVLTLDPQLLQLAALCCQSPL